MNEKSYEHRGYEAIACRQQFNTTQTKLPSIVIQEGMGKKTNLEENKIICLCPY